MAEFSYSHGALLTVRLDVPLCLLYEVQAQSTAYATFPGLRQSYLSVTPPAWVSVSTALKPTLTTFMFWLTGRRPTCQSSSCELRSKPARMKPIGLATGGCLRTSTRRLYFGLLATS